MTELPEECQALALRIHELLDGELDEAKADELRVHIDACERCIAVAELADKLKSMVRRSCSGQVAPAGLRDRIVTQITYTRIQIRPEG